MFAKRRLHLDTYVRRDARPSQGARAPPATCWHDNVAFTVYYLAHVRTRAAQVCARFVSLCLYGSLYWSGADSAASCADRRGFARSLTGSGAQQVRHNHALLLARFSSRRSGRAVRETVLKLWTADCCRSAK